MNKKTSLQRLCICAAISAVYAILTYVSGALGLAYGAIQFRLSEVLCVLPLFSRWSVLGLAVGCIIGNLASPFGIYDILFGTAATVIAGLLSYKFKNVRIKNIPFLSLLFPVVLNALLVGLEVALLSGTAHSALYIFAITFLEVFLGEGAVLFVPGLALYLFINKSNTLKNFLN